MKDNLKNMKDFEWQYSDEKLLLKKHENIISFLIDKTHLFAIYIVLWIILPLLIYLFFKSIIFIVLSIFFILWFLIIYLSILYKNTWLIITTRRVLELTQNWLFQKHKRELKLSDIKATSTKKWFIGTLFWFWRVTIKWTEESANIYFKWINESQEIVNYLWRVIDYIKLNGHTDNISRYKFKKDRKS